MKTKKCHLLSKNEYSEVGKRIGQRERSLI